MEGLGQKQSRIFLKVNGGKITMNAKEDTPGAIKKIHKDKTYWVLAWDYLEGKITGLKKNVFSKDGIEIDSLHIYIDKGVNGKYILTLPYNSGVARDFYNKMENIDYSKEVKFSPSLDDNDFNQLFLQQEGVWLKNYYNRDNPGGKPQWEKVKVNGKDVWDRTAELDFFQNKIDTIVSPQIEANKSTSPALDSLLADNKGNISDDDYDFPDKEPATAGEGSDSDDLPF